MPEPVVQEPTRALGTKLLIGTVPVAKLSSIGGIDASTETIDVTALDSQGGFREFILGFSDGGEVPVSGFFVPGDPGQADIYAAFKNKTKKPFKIVFPVSLGASWEFDGVITAYSTSAELEDAISFDSTIKVSGEPVLTLTTP